MIEKKLTGQDGLYTWHPTTIRCKTAKDAKLQRLKLLKYLECSYKTLRVVERSGRR